MVEMAYQYFTHNVFNFDELSSPYIKQTITNRNNKLRGQLLVLICILFGLLWSNACSYYKVAKRRVRIENKIRKHQHRSI